MNATSTRGLKVEAGGRGVVAHVGLHALGAFADRLGLGDALSSAIPQSPALLHDRGKVLVHAALVLAGGGESCADIEHLRASHELFGEVASDSTLYRTMRKIDAGVRQHLSEAISEVRGEVWGRSAATAGTGTVYLDIDSSLLEIHSENKEQTGPTYKGGFGFHPMFCFADATGEALSALLRAGNAGANKVADHVSVLDAAIDQLPAEIRAGHRAGDDPSLVSRRIVVRTDSAGTSAGFMAALSERNMGFFTVARSNEEIYGAILDAEGIDGIWQMALNEDGTEQDGAVVTELTSLVEMPGLPPGTRFVVRREPRHPGAQTSLFPSLEYRYFGFYTSEEGSPASLDLLMRQHAHVENHLARLKDSGLLRLPFSSFAANAAWLLVVCLAADLVRWFQLLCLPGYWKGARPKALRWGIFHAPGRIVRTGRRDVVRLLESWPAAAAILTAYRHAQAIT